MNSHPRGPLSAAVLTLLAGPRSQTRESSLDELTRLAQDAVAATEDLVLDEDVQLSLYLLNELHYGGNGTASVRDADDWEWEPQLLRARQVLETAFEDVLRRAYDVPVPQDVREVPDLLFAMAEADVAPLRAPRTGPAPRRPRSVASFVARESTLEQLREMLALRSLYQLKDADPHSFMLPRLRGRAKAALVEIQIDEYGEGRLDRMHGELFARCLRSVELSDRPNAYLDCVPAPVLAGLNALSLFALHRRLRGALCGHLAAFEMTSSLPSKRYMTGMQRLGLGEDSWTFYDVHVEADAVHEQIAGRDLCGGLLDDEPYLAADVLLGASVCLGLDSVVSDHLLSAWAEGRSALRMPLPAAGALADLTEQATTPLHLLRKEPTRSPAVDLTADDARQVTA